ncbi:MAG: hypothetical protein GX916_02340 [Clostridiales bacterium]|nr:hypothetical protein [Clostridiales bacterium]
MHLKKIVAVICLLAWVFSQPVLAGEQLVSVEYVVLENSGGTISYPRLIRHPDQVVMDTVNQAVVSLAQINGHIGTLSTLEGGEPGGLTLTSKAKVYAAPEGADVLTVLVEASGKMPTGRPGVQVTPMMFDLENGALIASEDIFADVALAQDAIDSYLEDYILDELSDYLDASMLTPVPLDSVLADDVGLTFYYPVDDILFLSGKPAAVQFHYHEIRDLLDLSPGSLLSRMGIGEAAFLPSLESAGMIKAACAEGVLPGVPAKLGDDLAALIEQYKMPIDSEAFPGANKYQLEDAAFRKTWLVSSGDEDTGCVEGIVSCRINLFGLITGITPRETCLAVLGEGTALPLDEASAALYGFAPGTLDLYIVGSHQLALNHDEQQVLASVWLSMP